MSYYVRNDGQDVFGPTSEDTVRRWIAEDRIGADSEFSIDGRNWVLGSQMPLFFPPTVTKRTPGGRERR